ncbi:MULTISPECIES: molybdopterin molybdotransferase MoeA [Streptomyces]|uniref:molybdopterin molybdotransferase MoeA n=1 Tax=Streptomyces TaxID=1883 RepID=UPI001E3DD379|nr:MULTISPECIES: molybdopterin molybdotransferase MoeA [Streptomyces]UFQ16947.1 molybdopterin molybdenumtransferase MoeA [Streptomyces huasconensis]WCL86549.1 molybdopterin molybdotransferase MoeA [Streptomyces sp. JCM 35825]
MSGLPAPDAELDEALALVNECRDSHSHSHGPTPHTAPPAAPTRRPAPTPTPASQPGQHALAARPATGRSPRPSPGEGGHREITPWPAARARAVQAVPRSGGAPVSVPLDQALGLTLAAPLTALTDLPSFDTSAMDGWAVAGPGPWAVRAEGVLAGHDLPVALADGEAVGIATGARIPRDATAVLRAEHGRIDDKGRLLALREVVPGQDIRPRGQECRSGDHLLPAGSLVTPAVLGLAAAAGYDTLGVVRRPRAEVLVLGDELLAEGPPREGLIRDALGPMLPPWLRALGAEVTSVRRLGDDAEALHQALTSSTADLIVTTGGTAAGPVDHVHPTLHRLGAELLVDGVAVRPGHPMLLARLRPGRYLVGLPGNPLAAVSGLLTLAEPLLRTLIGRAAGSGGGAVEAAYTAPVRDDVQGHPHDTRLVPVTLRAEHAVPLRFNGPAMLRGIAAADGLAVVPPGGARKGQELEILDLPWVVPGDLGGAVGVGLEQDRPGQGGSGECFT